MNDEPKETNEPFAIWEDVGMVVRYPQGIAKITFEERRCNHCQILEHLHVALSHPFFTDNLQYLLWKHERNNDPK